MATLDGTSLPVYSDIQRDTAWIKADRQLLDGTEQRDVTAQIRRFRLRFHVTAAELSTLRGLFYKTSPLRYIDTFLSVDCYVFTANMLRVEYYPVSASGGKIAVVELELWEHGATYTGASTSITEPTAGSSGVWSINSTTVSGPNGNYQIEYTKITAAHQLANGTIWLDTLGINRTWTLTYNGITTTDADAWRAALITLTQVTFLSPTTVDAASAKVYVESLPEHMLIGTTRAQSTIRLREAISGGASVPTCKVEFDVDGDGSFEGGVEDISAYVVSITIDRQGIRQEEGPSGVGGGISHEAQILLRHADGLFSPFNTAKRLTDNFYGKLVRISLGWGGTTSSVFVGRVITIGEMLKDRRAFMIARDLGTFLMQFKRGDTTLYENVRSDVYLGYILTQAGMSAGTGIGQFQLDRGNYNLRFAWMDHETYAQECDQIAAMEGGRLYWDMAGTFRFESASHLLGHSSAEVFTIANMSDLSINWDYDNIANRVVVESVQRYLAIRQVIWAAQETYRVPAQIERGTCATGSTTTVVNLTTMGSYGADSLKGEWLRITSGAAYGQVRKIKSNAATAAGVTAITVETAFGSAPASGNGYQLGGILELEARYNYPSANVVTPVAWTQALQDANGDYDYQVMTGGGQDATSDLAVITSNDSSTIYAASAKLYLVNSKTEAVYMQRLQLRGYPLLSRESRRTEEYDQASIDTYQERELAIAGESVQIYVSDEVQAKAMAQMYLARFKDPHAYWQMNGMRGDAAREIGRRVTVIEAQSGLSRDGFITAIRDSYSPGGGWSQDLTCVDAAMLGTTSDGGTDWFVLGTSVYGTGAGHGHLWY
jgi:hypothetical protein